MLVRGLAAAAVVVVLDQLSKAAILGHFGAADCSILHQEQVTWFLNLVLTCNRGMSFGLFNSGSGAGINAVLFSLVAGGIVAGLVYWLSRIESLFLAIAIGLVIGGAIGNVVDRVRLGAVVDFLDFHIGSLPHWPAFNIADSAICVGVAAILLDGLLLRREAH
jgi:signal peptidase II